MPGTEPKVCSSVDIYVNNSMNITMNPVSGGVTQIRPFGVAVSPTRLEPRLPCRAPLDLDRSWAEAPQIVDREGVVRVEHLQARATLLRDGLRILGAQTQADPAAAHRVGGRPEDVLERGLAGGDLDRLLEAPGDPLADHVGGEVTGAGGRVEDALLLVAEVAGNHEVLIARRVAPSAQRAAPALEIIHKDLWDRGAPVGAECGLAPFVELAPADDLDDLREAVADRAPANPEDVLAATGQPVLKAHDHRVALGVDRVAVLDAREARVADRLDRLRRERPARDLRAAPAAPGGGAGAPSSHRAPAAG